MDPGEVKAGLIIPPGYSDKINNNGQASVLIVLDGTNPRVASTSLSAAQLIAQAHSTQVQQTRSGYSIYSSAAQAPLDLRIIRSLMLKGVGVVSLELDIIAIIIYSVILMAAVNLRFCKRLD